MKPSSVELRKVRTFADDVKRARGGTQPSSLTPATSPSRTTPPPAAATPTHPLQMPTKTRRIATPTISPQAVVRGDGSELLNVNNELSGEQQANIITERRAERWSLTDEIGKSLQSWWSETIAPFKTREKSGLPEIAPTASRARIIDATATERQIAPLGGPNELADKLRRYAEKPPEDAPEITLGRVEPVVDTPQWTHLKNESVSTEDAQASEGQGTNAPRLQPLQPLPPRDVAREEEVAARIRESIIAGEKNIAKKFSLTEVPKGETPKPIFSEPPVVPTYEPRPVTHPAEQEVVPKTPVPEKSVSVPTPTPPAPTPEVPPLLYEQSEAPAPETKTVPLLSEESNAPIEYPEASEQRDEYPDSRPQLHDVLEEKTFTDIARERALARREREMQLRATTPVQPIYQRIPPIVIYAGVILIVFLLLITIGMLGYRSIVGTGSTPQGEDTRAASPLEGIAARTPVPLTENRTTFMIELARQVQNVRGGLNDLHEFYFVFPNDPNEQELPPEAFFDALDVRAPRALIRNISTMVFGAQIRSENRPFAVFRVRDGDEALGGMLEWERYMQQDLAPLFGEDQSVLGKQLQKFRDGSVGGYDARILRDDDGATLLIYTIAGNRLIIATSEEVVSVLLP